MAAPLIAITTYFYALISGGYIPHYHDETWALDEYGSPHVPYDLPAVINYTPFKDYNFGELQVARKHLREDKVTIKGYYGNYKDIPKEKLTKEAIEFAKDFYENADESALATGVFYFKYEGEEKGYAFPTVYANEIMFVPEEDVEKAQKIIEEQENKRK